ncbi:MAG TPA: phosphatase PAP2 family protein [Candidatus Nanoarchaeia archaeon]
MNLLSVDRELFLKINSFVGEVPILDNLVKLVVNEYFVPVSLALIILYLWFSHGKMGAKIRESLPLAVVSVGLINLIITVLNKFIIRPRPFDQLSTNLLFYKPTDPSFPSNAVAVGFALAVSIFLIDRRLGTFALFLASFYGFSRVYAGVHFPGDVVVGALVGIFVVLLVARFRSLIKFLTKLIERVQVKLKLSLDY